VGPRVPLGLPEPGTFERRLRPVRVDVSSLIRLSRDPATEPYWSAGVYRFDDPRPEREGGFGVCYAGNSIAVAFAESVIHEVGRFVDGRYEVPITELTERWVVRFRCARRKTLVLADLTGESLKALGLNNDISATNDYRLPRPAALGPSGSRREPALGRCALRVAVDEQGRRLRDLRSARAAQAQRSPPDGAADRHALRSVQGCRRVMRGGRSHRLWTSLRRSSQVPVGRRADAVDMPERPCRIYEQV